MPLLISTESLFPLPRTSQVRGMVFSLWLSFLFMPQGFNRIEPGGFVGGIKAEEDPHRSR